MTAQREHPAEKIAREQEEDFVRRADLIRSYKMVFGENPETRTADQSAVWKDLENTAFFMYSTAAANSAGAVDPNKTFLNEGKRMLFLYILANATCAPNREQQPQQK